MQRMRGLVVRIAAVGAGLAAGVLLSEGALRVVKLAPTVGVVTASEREFGSIPGILSPEQDLVDRRHPRLPYHVVADSLGYRGLPFPRRKPPGEFRVLFTGDSFVFGDFVNDHETLPAQLELRLRERCDGVRVVNAGLDAATIVDEGHMVERGLAVEPDLVLLLFSENDIADLNRASTWDQLAANRQAKSRFPLSIAYPVLRHTALWNFALQARANLASRRQPVRIDWSGAAADDSVTQRLRKTYRQTLVGLRDQLRARGVPLRLIAYPSHHALTNDSQRGQVAWLMRTATSDSVPAIDLLPALTANGEPVERLYLLPDDGHPSPRGYSVAATELADWLIAGSTLPSACRNPLQVTDQRR